MTRNYSKMFSSLPCLAIMVTSVAAGIFLLNRAAQAADLLDRQAATVYVMGDSLTGDECQ